MKFQLKYEVRFLLRDPVLLLFVFFPLVFALALRFLFPLADTLLVKYLAFNLKPFNDLILLFFLFLVPNMIGSAYGFLLLDETDQKTLGYYHVLPIGLTGYLVKKLIIPALYTLFAIPLVVLLLNLNLAEASQISLDLLKTPGFYLLMILFMLEAPLFALLVSSIARNKLEGLTVAKALGIVDFVPVLPYFLASPAHWLGAVIPFFWPAKLFLSLDGKAGEIGLLFGAGLLYHLMVIFILLKKKIIRVT